MAKKDNKSDLDKLEAAVVRERHKLGDDVEITEYPSGSRDVTARKDRQKPEDDAILTRLKKELNGNEEPLQKRTYRTNKQLPFPELGSKAEENRDKKKVTLRFSPDLLAQIDAAADKHGVDRTTWVTERLSEVLSEHQLLDATRNKSSEPE